MFVRVWEYEVDPSMVDAFLTAYGADGSWVRLFAKGEGFVGTELFRSIAHPGRFVTVDRWSEERQWHAFLALWGDEYAALDTQFEGLAATEMPLLEGVSQAPIPPS